MLARTKFNKWKTMTRSEPRVSWTICNRDTENVLASQLKVIIKASKRSEGLRFIRFTKNLVWHSDIDQSPYKTTFGVKPQVALSASILLAVVVFSIQNEENPNEILKNQENDKSDDINDSNSAENCCLVCNAESYDIINCVS